MELVRHTAREKYKTLTPLSAKIFALVQGDDTQQLNPLSPLTKLCEEVYLLETKGEIELAVDALRGFWRGFGEEIDISRLSKLEAANLILRIGSVASTYGSIQQIKDSQEISRNYLALAERLFDDLEILEGKAQCLNKIGASFYRNGDMETAEIYFRESIIYAQTQESIAISHLNIAMTESLRFNYEKALEYYENAYRLIGNISAFTEAKIRNGIGLVYKDLGRSTTDAKLRESYFDKALLEFQGALICYDETKNIRSAILNRNNIGFLYYSIGQFDEALDILNTAKTQALQIEDKSLLSIIYDTEARIHLATGLNIKAVSASANSVRHLDSMEDSNLLATSLITHGTALARIKQINQAKAAFENAQEVSRNIHDFKLAAIARLFELLELFSEFDEKKRLEVYFDATGYLYGSQEKDVIDALLKVTNMLKTHIKPASPEVEKNNVMMDGEILKGFSLNEKLKEITRDYFKRAIEQSLGNQSHAAQLLGMSRQTFYATVKKDFSDFLPMLKQIKKRSEH